MIYIALGSNLGNRLENLRRATSLLKNLLGEIYTSIVIETDAILLPGAPESQNLPYLNMIVAAESVTPPRELLLRLREIERLIGRAESREKWAPRVIDLDILLLGREVINLPELIVPHPELLNRPFLLHLLALLPYAYMPQIPLPGADSFASPLELTGKFTPDEVFRKSFSLEETRLVGIVNVPPDSFSDGGKYYDPEKAVAGCLNLAEEGAEIIDIGAQSTRPGAEIVGPDAEYQRLVPVLDALRAYTERNLFQISIDSYHPELIIKLLGKYKIDLINLVKTDALSEEALEKISDSHSKLVIMHSLDVPPRKNNIISINSDPIATVNSALLQEVDRFCACGVKPENIILDPGIGFGKSIYQNILLLRKIKELKSLGFPVLIGHSRKSFITGFSASNKDRTSLDIETAIISEFAAAQGADYLRIHNVALHRRIFTAKKIMQDGMDKC